MIHHFGGLAIKDPNAQGLLREIQAELAGRNRARRGSHVQGEIRAPGVGLVPRR